MSQFCELAGVGLDDWQAYVIGALFDVGEDGNWAASEFGLLVSRQNGKGEVLVAYDLAHLFLFPRPDLRRKTTLHTAHEMKTAIDGFERLSAVVQSRGRLMDRVENIYTANGKESIVLKPRKGQTLGDRIKFIARSKNSGRGFSGDVIVYDEAQELASFSRDALTYTTTTIRNRQEVFTGTAPSPLNDSEVFEGVRDRGRAAARRTGWMEWSPEGSEDPVRAAALMSSKEAMRDRALWAESIPALGVRIPLENIAEQVERATDLVTLGQERFSVWPNRPEDQAEHLSDLDIDAWKDSALDDVTIGGDQAVIAIALGRGGGFGTVAAASRLDDDQIAVEHKQTDRQTRWIAPYVRDLKAELGDALVVLDPKNASSIVNDLDKLGVKYLPMNMNEIAGAHSGFIEDVNAALVPHRDQPEVTASLELATTRKIGAAGLTWEPSDPTKPITHAQAVTWAHWGVKKREAAPPRKPAVVRGYA